MKKLAFIFFIFFIPVLVYSQKRSDSTFTLKVTTRAVDRETKIYLAYQIDGGKIIDSAKQDPMNGTYTFSGKVTKPITATLVADPDQLGLQNLITKTKTGAAIDLLQFYIYPGLIRLRADRLISGGKFRRSVINSDNQRLQLLKKPFRDKQMTISAKLRLTTNRQDATYLGMQLDSLGEATKPVLKEFVLANRNSFIALLALEEYAGGIPDVALVEPMFKRLSLSIRNTTQGKEFYRFLRGKKSLDRGARAPEFVQNDTSGKPISLSLFRGKYVMLDFWASWCGPCRQENPGLRQIYQDFKDRNFTILGLSLDAAGRKGLWLEAIKNDKLPWTQVSDLRQWDNQVAILYNVRSIPENFLIDPDGIIVARGLNLEELRSKLEQVLPKQ